jgi:hypothetical protein
MQDLARTLLAAIRDAHGRFAEIADDLEIDVPALVQQLDAIGADATVHDLFPADIDPAYVRPARHALVAKLLRDAGFPPGAPAMLSGDQRFEEPRFFPGDLVVEGALGLAAPLLPAAPTLVGGDLVVHGALHVASPLVVLGNVRAALYDDADDTGYGEASIAGDLVVARGVRSQAMLAIGGRVETPLLWLDYNQGFAKILGGCAVTVLAESDHGGSRIFGPVSARFVQHDELQTDEPLALSPLDALAEVLRAEVSDELVAAIRADAERGRTSAGARLWDALHAGREVLA